MRAMLLPKSDRIRQLGTIRPLAGFDLRELAEQLPIAAVEIVARRLALSLKPQAAALALY